MVVTIVVLWHRTVDMAQSIICVVKLLMEGIESGWVDGLADEGQAVAVSLLVPDWLARADKEEDEPEQLRWETGEFSHSGGDPGE